MYTNAPSSAVFAFDTHFINSKTNYRFIRCANNASGAH